MDLCLVALMILDGGPVPSCTGLDSSPTAWWITSTFLNTVTILCMSDESPTSMIICVNAFWHLAIPTGIFTAASQNAETKIVAFQHVVNAFCKGWGWHWNGGVRRGILHWCTRGRKRDCRWFRGQWGWCICHSHPSIHCHCSHNVPSLHLHSEGNLCHQGSPHHACYLLGCAVGFPPRIHCVHLEHWNQVTILSSCCN